jgi:hypothetical protein
LKVLTRRFVLVLVVVLVLEFGLSGVLAYRALFELHPCPRVGDAERLSIGLQGEKMVG